MKGRFTVGCYDTGIIAIDPECAMLRRIVDEREWGLEVSKSLASLYRKPEGASEMIPIPKAYSRLPKKHSLTSRHLLSCSHAH